MQLYPRVENQPPPDTHCLEILTPSRIKLRAAFAAPRGAKGTVLLMGGRAEFMERYFETMNDLVRRGYAVASFDWRGQGGSQRVLTTHQRGYIDSFANYDEDIDTIFTRLMVAHCPKPYYAIGHSTGGHMLLRALRGRKWLDKAVTIAPLLGLHTGAMPKRFARALAVGARTIGASRAVVPGAKAHALIRGNFERNPLTSDRRRWDRDMLTLEQHPELTTGLPTYAWVKAAMDSIDELQKWPEDKGPSCPTLVVLAGLDRVVDNRGTKQFLARAPGFSSITIADSQHEILNERNDIRERFFAAFDGFLGG